MESGQPFVRYLQLHAPGGVGLDEIDEVPWNFARRNAHEQGAKGNTWHHAFQEPTNRASRTNVYASDTQDRAILRAVVMKIYIVDAHNLAAVHVNHLLVEQIPAEQ